MRNALTLFNSNIVDARNLAGLHAHLTSTVQVPLSFDDLLRSQIVYAVSAFDKLMHDLIRIGMVEIFKGIRPVTGKYQSEPIPMQIHSAIVNASNPSADSIFEQAIFRKLKIISFQEPSKVADGLSYIWDESQKWQKIAARMSVDDNTVRTTLKLIIDRRNGIVHEADFDPTTNSKFAITPTETNDITDFLQRCGNHIGSLVI